jgi:hypothetical protein
MAKKPKKKPKSTALVPYIPPVPQVQEPAPPKCDPQNPRLIFKFDYFVTIQAKDNFSDDEYLIIKNVFSDEPAVVKKKKRGEKP